MGGGGGIHIVLLCLFLSFGCILNNILSFHIKCSQWKLQFAAYHVILTMTPASSFQKMKLIHFSSGFGTMKTSSPGTKAGTVESARTRATDTKGS